MIGRTLHHYRIVDQLGTGGMGEVYAAEDLKLQRKVALKLLPPDTAADPERLQRFQREARAVAALNHPNVVTIYSVEEADDIHFLTMELVEGKTLAEIIPAEGMALEEALTLAIPLVDAVASAHEHGIVHRDLKPANVMLATDGRLKVLDFGLAKLKRELSGGSQTTVLATQSITGRHTVVGTAAYMSPEQAEGRPVDHRSDIFSLGVILYEMACGRRPFSGDTVFSLISSIIKDSPPPPSNVNRDAPRDLDRVIARALVKDPAGRYQRATELRNDLEELQQRPSWRRWFGNVARAFPRPHVTRRAVVAALVTAAVAAGVLLLTWRERSVRRPAPGPLQATFRRLTAQPGVEQFPSLLPDGKWIVYAGQESGNWDIYLLSTSGQNPINLTADSLADEDEPAASPDGERIAFRSSREGGGIFVMGRTGEQVRRVTRTGFGTAFNPSWSPDGTEIAFTTEDVQLTPLNWEKKSELRIVDVNTGDERQLAVNDAVQASWSPHGHRIAYVARLQQAQAVGQPGGALGRVMDIWTVPAGGGEPVAVTDDRPADWCPVWSPDGGYLYFVSDRGGSMNLWRVAVDEQSGKSLGEPEPVTTPAPFLAHPSISADGRQIAYSALVQTSNVQKITLDPLSGAVVGEPSWVTTGSRLWANPDPSPDGQWVAFYSRDQPEGDVYVSRPDGTGLRQLTGDEAIDRVPHWSPDGTWVAFFSNRGGPLQVWKIRAADGSDLQPVTETGGVPVWSPDSRRLATSEALDFAESTIVVDPNRPSDAQTPQRLPRPDQAMRPFIPTDWSPDGTRLAGQIGFAAGGVGIVLHTFASDTYERLTDFGEWPVWLGDSRRLLFVSKGKEFWVLDTRTKEARKIYSTPWDVLGPPRVTRNGRVAFYSRGVKEADIYLLTFDEDTGGERGF